MCSMMFKQRKNFENNIFWNAKHNLREKGLNSTIVIHSEINERLKKYLGLVEKIYNTLSYKR